MLSAALILQAREKKGQTRAGIVCTWCNDVHTLTFNVAQYSVFMHLRASWHAFNPHHSCVCATSYTDPQMAGESRFARVTCGDERGAAHHDREAFGV